MLNPIQCHCIDASDLDVTILAQSLNDCFSSIQDHRSTRTLLHQLSDILTIAVLAVIAGGNGWQGKRISNALDN
jgi:DDE_Tnp_1-associated